MADVEIDYVAALGASEKLSSAGTVVSVGVAYIQGESTGVENPAGRVSLRLELQSRLTELRTRAQERASDSVALSDRLNSLRAEFGSLDAGMAAGDGS